VAIPAQGVGLFLAEHVRDPFTGPALSYGTQMMNVPFEAVSWMFETLGIQPHAAGLSDLPVSPLPVEFARIIQMLGLGNLTVLDVSANEKPDVVANLNDPVPRELCGNFGLIVDGGTLEHVFDIRQGIMNTANMLRPGGRVVHYSPVNNYVNHGFVQLSPTFYHDYYTANGFEDVRGVMMVQPRELAMTKAWNFFNYDHETMGGCNSMFCSEETQLAVYFTAKKTASSTSTRVPTQTYFARIDDGRGLVPYQFAISHDAVHPRVEQITLASEDGIFATISSIVHF
jgi:hypothetical protein